jgi:uncharacterized protein YndB with AHSA1/START domain
MGDIVHKKSIAAPPTAVYAALTEQHHPKSSLHSVFTS